jgi:hypothetical protein
MGRTAKERIEGDPVSSAVYDALIKQISSLDGWELQEKTSSFHVVRRAAFLGIHPRRGGILVNIVLATKVDSARVRSAERVSSNRWHNEVILMDPSDVDAELLAWIREGHALAA